MARNGFKYWSQQFDNNTSDLVKQEGFCYKEYISDFEKFQEQLPSKENFCSFLATNVFKCIDPKEFDLNEFTSNSSKGCASKLILNILKSYKNYTMIEL